MSTELRRFAEAFTSEEELRRHIFTLLTRMRTQGVQITHGPQEYGKDIVFYAPNAFNDWVLQACVIKNTRIVGSVDDDTGARNVLFQVEQALDTAHINASGSDEHISHVFVISPHECSQIAMRSIQGKLKSRSGQVEFLCGSRLLQKFAEHWPEFLFFESSLLGSYVAALQKAFEQTDPVSFLASQHNILSGANITWRTVYVRQTFEITLSKVDLLVDTLDASIFKIALDQSGLNNAVEQVRFASHFVGEPQVWESGDVQRAQELARVLEQTAKTVLEQWEVSWEKYRAEAEREGKSAFRNSARVRIDGLDFTALESLIGETKRVVDGFKLAVRNANSLVERAKATKVAVGDNDYLNYCRIQEVVKLLPNAFRKQGKPVENRYPEDLLDAAAPPLLITGPAGYGKTSFCKWNVLNDVKGLVEKRSTTIPVYVPLHQLATARVTSADEAFFRTSELQQLTEVARKNGQKLRIYLDGLDEVTTIEQQRLLMNLARDLRNEWPSIQIVVTGRDYISGPWLRWLSRVNLAELSEGQVEQLAANWLDHDADKLSNFHGQLSKTRTLKPLMHVPLLGTLIIAVFKKLRSLPEGRVKLYEIFMDLMCGGWDHAKNVTPGKSLRVTQ